MSPTLHCKRVSEIFKNLKSGCLVSKKRPRRSPRPLVGGPHYVNQNQHSRDQNNNQSGQGIDRRIYPFAHGIHQDRKHIMFCIPYVMLSVMPKLRSLDPNLADAALDLGATPWQALISNGTHHSRNCRGKQSNHNGVKNRVHHIGVTKHKFG